MKMTNYFLESMNNDPASSIDSSSKKLRCNAQYTTSNSDD